MPAAKDEIADVVKEHRVVCEGLLALAHKESEALKASTPFPAAEIQAERKALLARLETALARLTQERVALQQSGGADNVKSDSQVVQLVQTSLDTIMRVLVLDRENEEALLRRGLLPARSLPPAEQTRPGYVAQRYLRNA